ncbi:MAG: hypothetical protein IPK82_06200 [Polyangiaceae bacterium]|nr:hypothetical protein [Polyangiaceae bacterium]
MELAQLYQELCAAARKLGVEVRAEPFDPGLSDATRPRGGLCSIRGKQLILVDSRGSLPDRIATLAGALSQLDLESVFLTPIVRATIGAYQPTADEVERSFRRLNAQRRQRNQS